MTHLDWRGLSGEDTRTELDRLLTADRERGFDLRSALLTRLALARLSDTEVQVVWTFHHVLLDGWSVFQVLSDVFAAHAGTDRQLPARPPFREYLRWLGERDEASATDFWHTALAGFESPTALPYDRGPNHGHASRSARWHSVELSREVSAGLDELARGHRLTLNAVVQGAWALLLSRYSGCASALPYPGAPPTFPAPTR